MATEEQFEAIKKHITDRFAQLKRMLEANSDVRVIFPGISATNHFLGTGLAVGQWGNKDQSSAIVGQISQSIKSLEKGFPGKIEYGNVGDVEKTSGTRFPVSTDKAASSDLIHVWGANAGNWNLKDGTTISGEGQAKVIGKQRPGVFGIITTSAYLQDQPQDQLRDAIHAARWNYNFQWKEREGNKIFDEHKGKEDKKVQAIRTAFSDAVSDEERVKSPEKRAAKRKALLEAVKARNPGATWATEEAGGQQDASEFLANLVDALHNDDENTSIPFLALPEDEAVATATAPEFSKLIENQSGALEPIKKFEPELIFSTPRFIGEGNNRRINGKKINLGQIALGASGAEQQYELTSVICHHGGGGGGHYVTYVKENDGWWLYDSMSITGPQHVEEAEMREVAEINGCVVKYSTLGGLLPAHQNVMTNDENSCWANAALVFAGSLTSLANVKNKPVEKRHLPPLIPGLEKKPTSPGAGVTSSAGAASEPRDKPRDVRDADGGGARVAASSPARKPQQPQKSQPRTLSDLKIENGEVSYTAKSSDSGRQEVVRTEKLTQDGTWEIKDGRVVTTAEYRKQWMSYYANTTRHADPEAIKKKIGDNEIEIDSTILTPSPNLIKVLSVVALQAKKEREEKVK